MEGTDKACSFHYHCNPNSKSAQSKTGQTSCYFIFLVNLHQITIYCYGKNGIFNFTKFPPIAILKIKYMPVCQGPVLRCFFGLYIINLAIIHKSDIIQESIPQHKYKLTSQIYNIHFATIRMWRHSRNDCEQTKTPHPRFSSNVFHYI